MNKVFGEMDQMFALHDSVKRMLPSIESYYADPIIFMARTELREEGGPLDERTDAVLSDLDVLLAMQEAKRRQLSGGMIRSFDSLKFFVLYLGMALVAIGHIMAFLNRARRWY